MKIFWGFVAGAAFVVATNVVIAAETPNDFSLAVPLNLARGVNHIRNFDQLGHRAEIIYAWRENMNAHGYGIYSVLMLRSGNRRDWTLVTFETHQPDAQHNSEQDALYDEPFDGEETVASVRFVKISWQRRPATLAITARRDLTHAASFIDPAPVEFSIYRLVANTDQVPGWPFYYFDRVAHFVSAKRYCNSDLALMKELRLPLPRAYKGLNNEDGCIP